MLRYLDGFSTYATAHLISSGRWTGATNGTSSNVSVSASAARHGAAGLRRTQRRYYLYKDVTDELGNAVASATWTVGFAFRYDDAGWTAGILVAWYDSAPTIQCELRLTSTYQLQVTRNGTVLATGSRVLEAGRWYYVEWTLNIADAGGSTVVAVDQVTDINASGLDTRNGLATAQRFRVGMDINDGNGCPIDMTDLYIADDATRRGDCRIDVLLPNGAGTHADWTGAATDVDDPATPDDDTTYATTATAGHRSTFALGALAAGAVSVKGVAVNHRMRKDDAGARTARAMVRSGATDDPSDTFSVSDSYAWRQALWDDNPDTGAAWSVAAVNALEAGAELVS